MSRDEDFYSDAEMDAAFNAMPEGEDNLPVEKKLELAKQRLKVLLEVGGR